jgi:hypothetical protein
LVLVLTHSFGIQEPPKTGFGFIYTLGNVNMQDLIGLARALVGKDIVFRFFFRDEELGWMDG